MNKNDVRTGFHNETKTGRNKRLVCTGILFCAVFFLGRMLAYYGMVNEKRASEPEQKESDAIRETEEQVIPFLKQDGQRLRILVDAGHGGQDPGKVGIDGTLEKDLNLKIAQKLTKQLQEAGVEVKMIREKDCELGKGEKGNKKMADLNERLRIISEMSPDLTICIHQNSYTSENVSGPQVFFYHESETGCELAKLIQEKLIENLKPKKEREAKGNMSYYLLKKSVVPTVIVECGFLSNREESRLLNDESYQKRLVESVKEAVLQYFMEGREE